VAAAAETAKSPVSDTAVSSVEMESLISQVRDLLPDLGEGFVHLCLEYFDKVPEKVINALLEGLSWRIYEMNTFKDN